MVNRVQQLIIAAAIGLTAVAAIVHAASPHSVATFVTAAVALAALAALVGQSIEQVGEHLSPGATGLLQSSLGNLPELFVGIFALNDGLYNVVRAALVGSVLGNTLLVFGIAALTGGLRHGPQRFPSESPRMIAIILLAVYALSIPFWLRGGATTSPTNEQGALPLRTAAGLLALGSLGAALVSAWFVGALENATKSLGLSHTFTGLVIVALASNAVENAGGVRFALRARADYAVSTILNSPLQVALFLTPALVLASRFIGPTDLTLVFPTLQVAALAVAAIVVVVVVYDGEYI